MTRPCLVSSRARAEAEARGAPVTPSAGVATGREARSGSRTEVASETYSAWYTTHGVRQTRPRRGRAHTESENTHDTHTHTYTGGTRTLPNVHTRAVCHAADPHARRTRRLRGSVGSLRLYWSYLSSAPILTGGLVEVVQMVVHRPEWWFVLARARIVLSRAVTQLASAAGVGIEDLRAGGGVRLSHMRASEERAGPRTSRAV